MATGSVNAAQVLNGPGILYWAVLGTTLPTNTVTGGKFDAAAWPSPWVPLGATDEGSEFSDSGDFSPITVAESRYPVKIVTTGREASWSTALAHINKSNMKAALNGGTSTTTGTAGTTLTTVGPPTPGAEIRAMIGWQSEDDTVRFVGYQALNVGDLSMGFKPEADKTTLSIEWRLEKPTATDPWVMYLAGTDRSL